MRFQIGASMLTLGLLLAYAFGAAYQQYTVQYGGSKCSPQTWQAYLWLLLISFLFCTRWVVLGLAPLADDICIMRLAMLLELAASIASDFIGDFNKFTSLSHMSYYDFALFGRALVLCAGFFWAMLCREPGPMQRRMWASVQAWLWLNMLLDVGMAVIMSAHCHAFSQLWATLPAQLLLAFFISRPRLRRRCHGLLNGTFERASEKRAAAGVAGLVGGCPVKEVMAQASDRFRSVLLADLCFEDIADNKPNPALAAKAAHESLSHCDAFISHSWHDDARAKWAALQQWRGAFVTEHGREPRVWLDKCCIDQNDIDSDLRCLPIFLSGCKRMAVFCGPTYLSRLWCIMELFTFVQMSRGLDKIDFVPVQRADHKHEDARALESGFEGFDAEHCSCALEKDKDRMLSIIHAAFGATTGFNEVVRDIFCRYQMEDALVGQGSLRPGGKPDAVSETQSCEGISDHKENAPSEADYDLERGFGARTDDRGGRSP